ncbi:MAG: amidohydrolase family protein [Clostridiales bacterium]|nr:amidohydrolase family protein [Clostridiales bacterium]
MIIDAHCHIYPDKIADKASHNTGSFYSLPTTHDGKVSTLLRIGDEAGVDKFVVQSVATTPGQVSSINRFIAETVKNDPDRFYGLGTIHPESDDIRSDIEEIVSLGLKGVKIHPDIQKFKLDDYRYLKMYDLLDEYGLPALVHTGDHRYDYSNPNRMLPILEIYENVTFVGAHFGGWSVWEEAASKLKDRPNFFVDCSSTFYALDNEKVKKLIDIYGVDRVIFGTDYPMWDIKTELDRFFTLGYDKETEEKILYKNALRIYKLEP